MDDTTSMQRWISWLLMLGVIAGLNTRVIGADPCHESAAAQEVGCANDQSCGGNHSHQSPDDHGDTSDTPDGHHHGGCFHSMPLVTEPLAPRPFGRTRVCTMRIVLDAERVPDAPFADLDKPPLI